MTSGTTAIVHTTAAHSVGKTPKEFWYPKVVVIARGDVLHVLAVYSGGTLSFMCPNPEYREREPDCISGEKR